jgi:GAF domain-containing protein
MESITLTATTKAEKYQELLPQIEALFQAEPLWFPNLANCVAVLKEAFQWYWVGFYLVQEEQLVLGPFQGPLACTRIPFSKGVCGAAYTTQQTQLVPDVNQFPGHIACSAASQSEVVVPVFYLGKVVMVLDVDSEHLAHYDREDVSGLEQIMALVEKYVAPSYINR